MSKHLAATNERGVLTLPKTLRGAATSYEALLKDDGIIELVPQGAVTESQAWFWTKEWQAKEREADEAFAAGGFTEFADNESFLKEFND